jgi:hypothetical protein
LARIEAQSVAGDQALRESFRDLLREAQRRGLGLSAFWVGITLIGTVLVEATK